MANIAPEVMIPLKLQLDEVQGQLNSLKQKINKTVSPDTSAYKQLIGILGKAENNFINISAASKEAFRSEADIGRFKKQLQTLMTTLNSLGVKFETLNFKDLGLKDIDEITNFKKQIAQLDDTIKALKSKKIGNIFDDDLGEPVRELAKTLKIDLTKDLKFDDLNKAIEAEHKKLETNVDYYAGTLNDLEEQLKELQNLEKFGDQIKFNKVLDDEILEGLELDDLKQDLRAKLESIFGSTELSKEIEEALSVPMMKGDTFVDSVINAAQKSMPELKRLIGTFEQLISDTQEKANSIAQTQILAKGIFDAASSEEGIEGYRKQITILTQRIKELENQLAKLKLEQTDVNEEIKKGSDAIKDATNIVNKQSYAYRELVEAQERISNIKSAIKNWLGFSEVVNITKNALRDAYNNIKELDATMTEIAVVTDMSQSELWDQVSTYSAIAKQYGATTQGVYEVSQLYYQQGLDTASVMELTTETLKLARIAGVEYADATDYMTVAIRGFKMEMTDAQNVVDVYSNLAAVTASDVEELAVAMSKTASSAEAVGSSFENTSAMIALMVNFLPLIIEKLY